MPPDDERTRRRMSDDTRARIADLADGWSADAGVQGAPSPTSPPPPVAPPLGTSPEPRKKQKTLPPPPPGSELRKALDGLENDDGSIRTKAPTAPPPAPRSNPPAPPRPKGATNPPPLPTVKAPTHPPPLRTPTQPPGTRATTEMPLGIPTAAPYTASVMKVQRDDESGVVVTAKPVVISKLDASVAAALKSLDDSVIRVEAKKAVSRARAMDDSGILVSGPDPIAAAQMRSIDESGDVPRQPVPRPVARPATPSAPPPRAPTTNPPRAPSPTTPPRAASPSAPPAPPAPPAPKPPPPTPIVATTPPKLDSTEPSLPPVIVSSSALRPDATSLESGTERFSRAESVSEGTSTRRPRVGRLRTVAALRRQRGFFGDVRYVATAVFGVRRTRRELAQLEATQTTRQAERDRYLVTLGRTAVIAEGLDHPSLGPVRQQLVTVEEERAQHAASVVAAEQEQQRVTRDREERAKQFTTDLSSVDAELTELGRRAEPLAKEQVSVTRRAADLRDALRRLDEKIAEVNSQLVSAKPSKRDPAEIQAELATLRADRESVKRDEPALAGELDGLSPRLAAIDAKKVDSTKRRAELVKAEDDDKRRAEELLVAIGAKRKVMDRASNDAETLRDKIMYELAEQLYVDRPDELSAQLSPIDAIDVELGSADRRIMELREILSSVDKWKIVRGVAYLAGMLLALGAIVWFARWVLG